MKNRNRVEGVVSVFRKKKNQMLGFSFLFLLACVDQNQIDSISITKRIQPIIEAKAIDCDSRPIVPLIFTREASPKEVEDCERDLLASRCPFRSYPWSCVRIF